MVTVVANGSPALFTGKGPVAALGVLGLGLGLRDLVSLKDCGVHSWPWYITGSGDDWVACHLGFNCRRALGFLLHLPSGARLLVRLAGTSTRRCRGFLDADDW